MQYVTPKAGEEKVEIIYAEWQKPKTQRPGGHAAFKIKTHPEKPCDHGEKDLILDKH